MILKVQLYVAALMLEMLLQNYNSYLRTIDKTLSLVPIKFRNDQMHFFAKTYFKVFTSSCYFTSWFFLCFEIEVKNLVVIWIFSFIYISILLSTYFEIKILPQEFRKMYKKISIRLLILPFNIGK